VPILPALLAWYGRPQTPSGGSISFGMAP
jgi:hypothetical protein